VEQVYTVLVSDGKLKDPTNVFNIFNNLFKTITAKLNIKQIQKGYAISVIHTFTPLLCR
jgi:hypothetical protein